MYGRAIRITEGDDNCVTVQDLQTSFKSTKCEESATVGSTVFLQITHIILKLHYNRISIPVCIVQCRIGGSLMPLLLERSYPVWWSERATPIKLINQIFPDCHSLFLYILVCINHHPRKSVMVVNKSMYMYIHIATGLYVTIFVTLLLN